mgnify:CR=1 FL=1|jgi:thiamine-monophosphate kinase
MLFIYVDWRLLNLAAMPEDADDPFESEAHFIRFLTQRCMSLNMAMDLSDDCAWLKYKTDLLSTDTIIEGVHFEQKWATPEQIGRQAAVVSLSDLAASGSAPRWAMLSLELPKSWLGNDLRALCEGFLGELNKHDAALIGGNCARTGGPLSITVTVGGSLYGAHPITRSNANPGDILCVSGVLGAAALAIHRPSAEHSLIRHNWRPHFDEAQMLVTSNIPTAMMDISDGLVVDAARIAHASEVNIYIDTLALPVLRDAAGYPQSDAMELALYGGEDYVLLFTCSPTQRMPSWAFPIGTITEGVGTVFVDHQPQVPKGFDHFRVDGGLSQ